MNAFRLPPLLLSAVLALSGCVTAPTPDASDEAALAPRWDATLADGLTLVGDSADAVAPESGDAWWRRWGIPELLGLIELARQRNPDVRAALANLRAAAAASDEATAALFPTFDLSGQDGASKPMGGRSSRSAAAGVAGSWDLSLVGGDWAARRAARLEEMSLSLTLADVRNAIASEVAQNYVSLCLAHVSREIAAATLDNYAQAAEIAGWRFQAGLVDQSELDQAVSNREVARAAMLLTENSVAQYRNAIARLTAVSVSELPFGDLSAIPVAPLELAVSLPAATIRQRPDMRAAELSVAAASERVYEARSQWFPALSVSGSLGTEAATVSALGASGTGVAALLGALSMPLLNWGSQVAASERALANLDAARAGYTATLVAALEETENALTAIRTAQTRLAPLSEALRAAVSAADLTLQQYQSGLVDYESVLSTQRTLLTARESEAGNRAELAVALITLFRAMGGGWTPDADTRLVLEGRDLEAARAAAAPTGSH